MSAPSTAALQQTLAALREDPLAIDTFLLAWRRDAQALCAQLPPRFDEVLQGLLTRLESSRLFAGDACAFSRDELLDTFALWLDKAEARLAAQT
ncbi:hypothetical protein OPU71_06735 [Niveibacterium sp. 24ML]|uniref:hypothetical protein n=1 Tax=Niveibacterium sp. 24ML TaxID=2985512 RepID=UPI002271A758|nr:hypothetical protein [Niveibacterium sp. 24ML]MCX9155822.1 hypothetical protein [Niveibacterium sp. 24ML]